MKKESAKEVLTPDSPFYPVSPEQTPLETRRCVAFILVRDIRDGLDLLLKPLRLKATYRR